MSTRELTAEGDLFAIAWFALEFCHETRAYPQFARWLRKRYKSQVAVSIEQLQIANLAFTASATFVEGLGTQ
jgi:hypothetical protein